MVSRLYCLVCMFLVLALFSGTVMAQSADSTTSSGEGQNQVVTMPQQRVISECECNYDGVCDESECGNCKDCMAYISTVSGETVQTQTMTTSIRRLCAVDDTLMKELDSLMLRLNEAEKLGDSSETEQVMARIREVKQKIEAVTNCGESGTSGGSGSVAEAVATQVTQVLQLDKCAELKDWEAKRAFYMELKGLSDDDLRAKGYSSREEVEETIMKLDEGIARIRVQCRDSTSAGEGGSSAPVTVERPIVATSTGDISSYYRIQIEGIMNDAEDVETKIQGLKELRSQIDGLISELIKSSDSIDISEVSDMVEEIEVRPGKVIAGDVTVDTSNKRILTTMKEKQIEVSPGESHVVISEEGLEVNAPDLKIDKDRIMMGESEVKVTPSEAQTIAVNRIRTINSMELKSEEGRAVYSVEGEDQKNLLGFIPVTVERKMMIDAGSAETIKEEGPWWSFMAF
ncbi:MAG: hypothetical protein JW754_00615 [Candidatus Aenigmarchaeota archaeon]|nr:hypothetical protein [Candidatus Aenigmarchaeota archaeon]